MVLNGGIPSLPAPAAVLEAERAELSVGMAAETIDFQKDWEALERLHRDALALLAGLDGLGLYQAGAFVSMALDVMRRQHPDLGSSE